MGLFQNPVGSVAAFHGLLDQTYAFGVVFAMTNYPLFDGSRLITKQTLQMWSSPVPWNQGQGSRCLQEAPGFHSSCRCSGEFTKCEKWIRAVILQVQSAVSGAK